MENKKTEEQNPPVAEKKEDSEIKKESKELKDQNINSSEQPAEEKKAENKLEEKGPSPPETAPAQESKIEAEKKIEGNEKAQEEKKIPDQPNADPLKAEAKKEPEESKAEKVNGKEEDKKAGEPSPPEAGNPEANEIKKEGEEIKKEGSEELVGEDKKDSSPVNEEEKKDEKLDEGKEGEQLKNPCVLWIINSIKDNILKFDPETMWNHQFNETLNDYIDKDDKSALFFWVDKDKQLRMNVHEPPAFYLANLNTAEEYQFVYFLKTRKEKKPITIKNIENMVYVGLIDGQPLDDLHKKMDEVFIPAFMKEEGWPEVLKKDFKSQLQKFMALLVESANISKGITKLYIPKEEINNLDDAAKNKDLVQRLESTLLYWTRQIKDVVQNQDISQDKDTTGPLEELSKWKNRQYNLSQIRSQLDDPMLLKIKEVLRKAESNYLKGFEEPANKIMEGTKEAENNIKFLSILYDNFRKLEKATPQEIPSLIPDIMNKVRIIWEMSDFYNTPERISGLLTKISNEIINRCRVYISIDDVFEGDVEKAMKELDESIQCGIQWKLSCENGIEMIKKYSTKKNLEFNNTSTIFAKVDTFVQRCKELKEICEGQQQFARKGKGSALPEFAGSKAQEIVHNLDQLKESFQRQLNRLVNVKNKILDVSNNTWHDEFTEFKNNTKDLEVMFQNIISLGFSGISTVREAVEMLENFDQLAIRISIKDFVRKKSAERVYKMFGDEIKAVETIYDTQSKGGIQMPLSHPYYSGQGLWIKSLIVRLDNSYQAIKSLYFLEDQKKDEHDMRRRAREDYKTVKKNLESAIKETAFAGWKKETEALDTENIAGKLNKNVLIEDAKSDQLPTRLSTNPIFSKSKDSELLECNFDKILLKTFAEVKYWEKLQSHEISIPHNIHNLFTDKDKWKLLREQVMLVVREYNKVLKAMNPEEKRIFHEHINDLFRLLEPGLKKYKWTTLSSSQADTFVRLCKDSCDTLDSKLQAFKTSNNKIQNSLQKIKETILVDIDKKKIVLLDEFVTAQEECIKKKLEEFKDQFEIIRKNLNGIYEFFIQQGYDVQIAFCEYIDSRDVLLLKALHDSICGTLVEIMRALKGDSKTEPVPIIRLFTDIDVKSSDDNILVDPTHEKLKETFAELIRSIRHVVKNIAYLGKVFRDDRELMLQERRKAEEEKLKEKGSTKITESSVLNSQFVSNDRKEDSNKKSLPDIKEKNSFYQILSSDHEIKDKSRSILEAVEQINAVIEKEKSNWKIDTSVKYLRNLQSGKTHQRLITSTGSMDGTAYSKYEKIIQHIQNSYVCVMQKLNFQNEKFIQIDSSKLKKKLLDSADNYRMGLFNMLHEECKSELFGLYQIFEEKITQFRRLPSSHNDLKINIEDHKKTVASLPDLEKKIQPIEEKYHYFVTFSEQILSEEEVKKRAELKGAFEIFKKDLEDTSQIIEKAKKQMSADMHHTLEDFEKEIEDNHKIFDKTAPKTSEKIDVPKAKGIINEFKDQIKEYNNRVEAMKFGMLLFGIEPRTYKDLVMMEKDISLLEIAWNLKEKWDEAWNNCKPTPFRQLVPEDMEERGNQLIEELNNLPKEIRDWPLYINTKREMDKYKELIPIVIQLSSESMKERHWEKLYRELKEEFDPDSNEFTLEKLDSLKLNMYADFINQLAEEAQKDLVLEKKLLTIKNVWSKIKFNIEDFPSKTTETKCYKLGSAEDLFQALERDINILSSTKSSSSFMAFQPEIEKWESDLSTVSDTLEKLIQVQKEWSHLESIFHTQQELSKQLPKESNTFERVHKTFMSEMEKYSKNPYALVVCANGTFLGTLSALNKELEATQRALNQFLDTKRKRFPRFYFLSNDDLLEILGQSKNPASIMKHLKKCFEAISSLELNDISKNQRIRQVEILGMKSPEEEKVPFDAPILVDQGAEEWMRILESRMIDQLKHEMHKCYNSRISMKEGNIRGFIQSNPGQLVITACQIHWTLETQRAIKEQSEGNQTALTTSLASHKKHITFLTKILKPSEGKIIREVKDKADKDKGSPKKDEKAQKSTDLDPLTRLKLVALIIVEVHNRDIREFLVMKKVNNLASFEWLKQLRFEKKDENDTTIVTIKQTNTEIPYGYEYQGNNGRLVITPLTDRCFLTLTTALFLNRGGAPQGPAGTGKTETVKDLGKNLAKQVIVFNCSDSLDEKSLGRMFSGLAQTGAWGCFDEFNRIEIEVLSVVAQQISTILDALRAKLTNFHFENQHIPLNSQCGIFITMNPGYTGRTELPDNLKTLFRPVAMMVPDSDLIAEINLLSEGFESKKGKESTMEIHKELARKVVTIYRMMKEQLSKQDHYDFGMRALKSVLTFAGKLRRDRPDLDPNVVMMQAIHDMNMPKLTSDDIPLFAPLLMDHFPRIDLPEPEIEDLLNAIEEDMKNKKLQLNAIIIEKVVQVYDSKNTRHGNMIVGKTLAGKSTCWKILMDSMNVLSKSIKGSRYKPVKTFVINPKSIEIDELFGNFDKSREWHDGILSSTMKQACEDTKDEYKWIILDGPVDTLWIESMNSLLDDSKILTLNNGDRIKLTPNVSLLFEVENLAVASPATVSRAGMIYMDGESLGWKPYVDSWIKEKSDETTRVLLNSLIEKYVPKMLKVKKTLCTEQVQTNDTSLMISFCNLFDALLPKQQPKSGKEEEGSDSTQGNFEKFFVFALIWSVGGTVDEKSRKEIDQMLRDTDSMFPTVGSIYDYTISVEKGEFVRWDEKLSDTWKIPEGTPFYNIQVPTVDILRNRHVSSELIKAKKHVLIVGQTGVGKTALVQGMLKIIGEIIYYYFTLIFTGETTSTKTQEIIESKFEKRTKNKLGPPYGKKAICFIDDFNMPKKDTYGTQPPLELIRQWMDYGGWYDRQKLQFKDVTDLQLIVAMGPPGGGRAEITSRIQSRFHVLCFTMPSDDQIIRIYSRIADYSLLQFEDEEIKQLSGDLAKATLNLFYSAIEVFLPTPTKCHYLFNLRDISKVFQGLNKADKNYYESKDAILRLWAHEVLRVFFDRLVSVEDRENFKGLLQTQLETNFSIGYNDVKGKTGDDAIFVDFLMEDVVVYKDAASWDELRNVLLNKLNEYNSQPRIVPLNIVLFKDAIAHFAKIYRILKMQRGNGLLLGVGGSGRHTLTKLAIFLANMELFQLEITRDYNIITFRAGLKDLFNRCAIKKKEMVFIFSDNEIIEKAFLEDVSTILSSGEVPNIHTPEELGNIRQMMQKDLAGKINTVETPESLYEHYVTWVRNKLHIVLCMSPIGVKFRDHVRSYPAIVNNTMINWFMAWPDDALKEVAIKYVIDNKFSEELVQKLPGIFTFMHSSVVTAARKMQIEHKRMYYVTPTNYMELLKGYTRILGGKQKEIGDQIEKLTNGLQKLEDAQNQVNKMTTDSENKKMEMSKKHKTCEELMTRITQEKVVADEKQKFINEAKLKIDKEREDCNKQLLDAQAELEKAQPALLAAQEAIGGLDKKDIAEVKGYTKPPVVVETVLNAVMVVLGETQTFATAKKVMANPEFIKVIKEFNPENITNKILIQIEKYTKRNDFDPNIVDNVSHAASALCLWVRSLEDYAKAYRTILPKQQKRDQTLEEIARKEQALQKLNEERKILTDRIEQLEIDFKKVTTEMEEYKKQVEELQEKIDRGEKLVSGLMSEKVRWERSNAENSEFYQKLNGDCLASAAFTSYCGPFLSNYRDELLDSWVKIIIENEIKITADFDFGRFMIDPAVIREWNLAGLPSDKFSSQNGILVMKGDRWPLMIDPQYQASTWIKNIESSKLIIANRKHKNYLNEIKKGIKYGKSVLLPDIGEEIEPDLEPVLNKSLKKLMNRNIIKVGADEIDYNFNFRFYITTNLANPHYNPEISTKVTLVNFAVKEQGLEEQLLDKIFENEEEEQYKNKSQLVFTISQNQKEVKENEDKILRLLKESKVDILDDIELINILQQSKEKADEKKQNLENLELNMKTIESTREKYRKCAKVSSIIFFVLNDMSKIDHMYQFSLEWYINLFKDSLIKSKKENQLIEATDKRIEEILTYHKISVYKTACRSLFERHKLLLALQMCIKLTLKEKDFEEWLFFLKGGVVMDRKDQLKNPQPQWITANMWDNITELDKIPAFNNIAQAFTYSCKEWKRWYELPQPEKSNLPGEWESKCEELLRKMIILRCLRPDRVIFAANTFVDQKLEFKTADYRSSKIADTYKDSKANIPFIFILSPGVDPYESLLNLAKNNNINEIVSVSLGQGQSAKATGALNEGITKGNWVYFANCHLAISWLTELESLIDKLSKQNPSPTFRLFLSSNPDSRFPILILQKSIKMTTEPPTGIKANMLRIFTNMADIEFKTPAERAITSRALFGLVWFHAILIERKKFKTLGWNVMYDFNEADFGVCKDLICYYASANIVTKDLPWSAIQELVAECNYGGRVTDEFDRKLINVYAFEIFDKKLLEINWKPCPDKSELQYISPEMPTGKGSDEDRKLNPLFYAGEIQTLFPIYDLPEAFGQHINAEISSQISDTNTLLNAFLLIQQTSAESGIQEIEQAVINTIKGITEILPESINIEEIIYKKRNDDSPLKVVLIQECYRYDTLLRKVSTSLNELQKGIKGLVTISPDLEEVMNKLNELKVPNIWLNVYPSLKPLGIWARDLKERVQFFVNWGVGEQPYVFWISAFSFPTGFTTSLLQKYARKFEFPIDSLYMDFAFPTMEKFIDHAKEGAYIRGLNLEGAKWDLESQSLGEPETMKLTQLMPVIQFKPAQKKKKDVVSKKDGGHFYSCPTYYYPIRQSINGKESFVMTINLKSGQQDSTFWIKRGAALLLSLAE